MIRIALFSSMIALGALGLADAAIADEPKAAVAESRSQEDVLRERATEYWGYKVSGSGKVYGFYQPPEKGGPKKTNEVTEGGQVGPESFEITAVEIDGDRAKVRTTALMDTSDVGITMPDHLRTIDFANDWFQFEGVWYRVPSKPTGLPTDKKVEERKAKADAEKAATPGARAE